MKRHHPIDSFGNYCGVHTAMNPSAIRDKLPNTKEKMFGALHRVILTQEDTTKKPFASILVIKSFDRLRSDVSSLFSNHYFSENIRVICTSQCPKMNASLCFPDFSSNNFSTCITILFNYRQCML